MLSEQRLKEIVDFSYEHGPEAAALQFNIKRDTVTSYRRKLKSKTFTKPKTRPLVGLNHDSKPDDKIIELFSSNLSFEEICNRLDQSPSKVRKIVASLQEKGIRFNSAVDGTITLSPQEQIRTVQDSRILPSSRERQQIGVLSTYT